MRYAWLLALFVIGVVLAPAVAAQGLSDVAITNVFGIYKANDRYVVYGADSSGNLVIEVLDSSLTPVAAYSIGAEVYKVQYDSMWFQAHAGEGWYVWYNSSASALEAIYFNVSANKFYMLSTNVSSALPSAAVYTVYNESAPSYVLAIASTVNGYNTNTLSEFIDIVYSLPSGSGVINLTASFANTISATQNVMSRAAPVIINDTVYFALASWYSETPALYFGYYNITNASGVLYTATVPSLKDYGASVFTDTNTYMVYKDGLLHIVVLDNSYGLMSYIVINASDMSMVKWLLFKNLAMVSGLDGRARLYGGFMVVPALYRYKGANIEVPYSAALLLDLDSLDVYIVSPPIGYYGVGVFRQGVGGVAIYNNGSIALLRLDSLDGYLRGCYSGFCAFKAGVETIALNVTSDVTIYDNSTALSATARTDVTTSFAEITPSSYPTFSVSTESIEYYPKSVTKTVSEPVPVPVETTVTSTVTTTVEKPVIGTEALIAILFIMLIVAAAVIMRRR